MSIPQVQKLTLDNGIKVLVEKMPWVRSLSCGLFVGVGSSLEETNEAGLCHFIEHLLFKGTKNRSAFQIAKEIDAIGGRINAYTTKEYTSYYCVVLDRHLKTAVDILSDIFVNPKFDPKDIETEKNVILEEINMLEDTPDELIHDFLAETLLPKHPFGKQILGNKKSVGSFKQENLLSFRNKLYTPDNLIISIAGNVDFDELASLIKERFDSLKGKKRTVSMEWPEIASKVDVKRKRTEQIHLAIGFKGLSQLDDRRYSLAVLDNLLGGFMSSRLFQEVREKRGLVYSIFSGIASYYSGGYFYIYAGCAKENVEKVIEIIFEELIKLKKGEVTLEEIDRAKEHLKGTLVLGMESTFSRMGYISKSEHYYDRIVTVDEIFNKIDSVNKNSVSEIADDILDSKSLNLVVIGEVGKDKISGIPREL
jgi:predicted Zn-dependent peptidase